MPKFKSIGGVCKPINKGAENTTLGREYRGHEKMRAEAAKKAEAEAKKAEAKAKKASKPSPKKPAAKKAKGKKKK